jgi:hypothetical protein
MLTDVLEIRTASETSVNIYLTTWQYIPEDSKLCKPTCLWQTPPLSILEMEASMESTTALKMTVVRREDAQVEVGYMQW